ncbi:hypothetical protein C8Q75DRAFT_735845 [Abortiporus biennis]|nr:hypothetical protein C8Q75DRAFT_735845 [Abortiporus biennis]
MNSPHDPGSPESESSSSDSPPFDDAPQQSFMTDFIPNISRFPGFDSSASGASKRRAPPSGGAYGSGSSARDPKTRRREEGYPGRRGLGGGWGEHGGGARQKEELVDTALVDQLRILFGDPFDETLVKKSS